ncbi:EamA family transporter RarD [Nocardiopsis metallicus]|uniref:Chloramphenicol-sensitive protein RarD n=1 Tax=Nocardiopsis metallicus TaxID=179819 RepID=A0A840WNT7_9ACTN|nr:EamA family transporter RarD [Nocardiopsis metallicus]MBB5494671.1 chloramphenicol-sensitive protein RarD [Nocardiopsis metallicus]
MPETNRGVALGATAFLMWGFAALYWPFLSASEPSEVLAHRMVWALLAMCVFLLLARRGWSWLPQVLRSPRQLLLVAAAAVLISVNWWGFIYSVSITQTLQASLAYFINPLMTVCLGVVFFAERLRAAQWVAVGLGVVAVGVMTVAYGSTPWLSLLMASSFAAYGAVKKYVSLDGMQSLTVETLMMFLPALGFVLYLEATGAGTAFSVSPGHTILLVGGGFVTALPLLLFGLAARRVPLSVIGMLQFIAPTMMFLIGWLIQGEEMPLSRWIGFLFVWLAVCVFAYDQIRSSRARSSAARAEAARVGAAQTPTPRPEPRV